MLCVCAKVWYTAMINSNCWNRTVVKHGMMFCCLLCATTGMLDFLLAVTFSVFLSQSIPVMDFQYWSCKSWVLVLILDIKVLVWVLKLLSLGLGLGLEPRSLVLGLGSLGVLVLVLDKRVGPPGEVHLIAKSPFTRYKLTFHHLVMCFVTFRKQLISYYSTNSWKQRHKFNNKLHRSTCVDISYSRWISHWRLVTVFQ